MACLACCRGSSYEKVPVWPLSNTRKPAHSLLARTQACTYTHTRTPCSLYAQTEIDKARYTHKNIYTHAHTHANTHAHVHAHMHTYVHPLMLSSQKYFLQTRTDIYKYTHTHVYTHTDIRTYTRRHTHTRTHAHTHTHTKKHTKTHTHTYARTHTHTHTNQHTNTHMHTHTYTDTHRHTDTHTHKHSQSMPSMRWIRFICLSCFPMHFSFFQSLPICVTLAFPSPKHSESHAQMNLSCRWMNLVIHTISHVPHMDKAFHTHVWLIHMYDLYSCMSHTHVWVVHMYESYICMSRVTHMFESCHACECVISRAWMCGITHECFGYRRWTSHVIHIMSHGTQMPQAASHSVAMYDFKPPTIDMHPVSLPFFLSVALSRVLTQTLHFLACSLSLFDSHGPFYHRHAPRWSPCLFLCRSLYCTLTNTSLSRSISLYPWLSLSLSHARPHSVSRARARSPLPFSLSVSYLLSVSRSLSLSLRLSLSASLFSSRSLTHTLLLSLFLSFSFSLSLARSGSCSLALSLSLSRARALSLSLSLFL